MLCTAYLYGMYNVVRVMGTAVHIMRISVHIRGMCAGSHNRKIAIHIILMVASGYIVVFTGLHLHDDMTALKIAR